MNSWKYPHSQGSSAFLKGDIASPTEKFELIMSKLYTFLLNNVLIFNYLCFIYNINKIENLRKNHNLHPRVVRF